MTSTATTTEAEKMEISRAVDVLRSELEEGSPAVALIVEALAQIASRQASPDGHEDHPRWCSPDLHDADWERTLESIVHVREVAGGWFHEVRRCAPVFDDVTRENLGTWTVQLEQRGAQAGANVAEDEVITVYLSNQPTGLRLLSGEARQVAATPIRAADIADAAVL
jgi:hypothetical protein